MSDIQTKKQLPRIAIVSTHGYVAANPPLGSADTGGQVVYVLELSKKLAQLGYYVDIWTRRFEDQNEIESVSENVNIVRIACGGRDFIPKEYLNRHMEEWSAAALRYISENELIYTFINSQYWDAGVGSSILSKALGVPHIFTPHSLGIWKKQQMELDYPHESSKFEAQYNFSERISEERRLVRECKKVIATTPEQSEILRRDYDAEAEKCVMIPPGYDDTRFFSISDATRGAIRERLGFNGSTILAIGRLARNKGYDLLIDAFSIVLKRIPDARLFLAIGGDGATETERKILEDLKQQCANLGISGEVTFGSFIPDEQMADYYRAADVFALSSRYEPFGMTAIEAMACGTPTVITIHGGLHKAVAFGRHALFADPFDKEGFGIMIAKILKHTRLRERLSRMGAFRVKGLFTWTGIAQQVLKQVDLKNSEAGNFKDDRWDEPWDDVE